MFDILTPTYNRAHTLGRVLQSLLDQTEKRFTWLIIDDASTDDTEALIEMWKDKYPDLHIEYIKLDKNGGKSRAVNIGLEVCKNPYVIIADSDDGFDASTLSDLRDLWHSIDEQSHADNVAAIWSLVKRSDGNLIGERFPEDRWLATFEDRILNYDIQGEKWHCWRTAVLRKYGMYVHQQCHVEESATWNRINRDYLFLCVNLAHRTYYESQDGMILRKKSTSELAAINYVSTYYDLANASIKEIIRHKFFRLRAFDHIKSRLHFNDKKLVLSPSKRIISFLIFLFVLPKRLIKKLL
ncbi:MAG: glycosyltransferase family 2 protein [Flavobacteriaceae bacterium]|nr:glycosyltransferase family 2 protein [Flavobacteriaceae bacterium]